MGGGKPPPMSLWLKELPWLPLIAVSRFRRAKKVDVGLEGDLPPVLVLPGLMSSDSTTSFLRRTLEASGFATYGSQLGLVTGVTPERLERAERRLTEISDSHGEPAVLLGWSLGGIFARVLAQRHPQHAKMVVTLGTPFSGSRSANNAWRLYNARNDHTVHEPNLPDDPSAKPPVHTVAVWSEADGVIAPECARGKGGERDAAHQLGASHFGFGCHRASIEEVVQIIAKELAMGRGRSEPSD